MIDIGSEPISHVSFVWSDHWAPNILRLYLISLVSLGPVLSSGNEVQENRHFAEWGNCSESQFQPKRQKIWRTTRRNYHITHTDHLLQPGEEELHCLCPDSLCNEHIGKKKVFIILLHYYPSPSGLWRVGRVHLLGEHRSRLFRRSSRSSCCYLLHLWHRKLSLVLFRIKSLV